MDVVKEVVTEAATADSIQHALDDHHIPWGKILAIHLVDAQLAGGPGAGPRYKILYRGRKTDEPPAPPEPPPRAVTTPLQDREPDGWPDAPATAGAAIG